MCLGQECPLASNRPLLPNRIKRAALRLPLLIEKTKSGMQIFSHQSAAYAELLLRAQTFFAGNWRNLPIRTRWHSLILGPTGTGKSTLGTMLAEATGAALCRISITGYMPSGAHNRAVAETISIIIDHIHRHSKSILFLEEIEKIWHDTSWNSYIRGEVFEILDGRLPVGVKAPETSLLDADEDGTLTGSQLSALTEKLHSSAFIIGAGTFQEFYETPSNSRPIGFHQESHHTSQTFGPSADFIAKKLPRELLNRFNSSLLVIPSLEPTHYQLIAQQAEKSLPEWIQAAFKKAAAARMSQAIVAQSGCRFIEEALADALKCTEAPPPEPAFTAPDLC